MKYARFFAVLLTLCLLLTACGGAASTDKMMENELGYAESVDIAYRTDAESPAETTGASGLKSDAASLSPTLQTDRKLIKTVEISAETEHYDDLLSALDDKITALGGYVETRRTGTRGRSNRNCSITIRIPAESLGSFLAHVSENANVLSTYENTQDVTLQYTDTEAKITALRTEEARLLELLAQAGSLYDILEIQSRLSDVTYELERYESQKRGYDNQITYATIYLSIDEVKTLTPVEEPTVWQRITEGFADSLDGVGRDLVDFFVWLVVSLPYLVVWVPAAALILWALRKLRRKVQKRRHAPPSETP